ncbi:hypothetical protein EYF80_054745 [Liparis tanakae]|uniref:Uncharacterized protein n=1 Tax=Liparis tanakae TaxID=230148 RepID=A0A4Z2F1T7_9TELE|nr:hypothetical protein EYF80_054745 [Liparis tanakae]
MLLHWKPKGSEREQGMKRRKWRKWSWLTEDWSTEGRREQRREGGSSGGKEGAAEEEQTDI